MLNAYIFGTQNQVHYGLSETPFKENVSVFTSEDLSLK